VACELLHQNKEKVTFEPRTAAAHTGSPETADKPDNHDFFEQNLVTENTVV
jgi:hypothetical protein